MKNSVIKNIGLILWFLICQGIGTICVFIIKLLSDNEWYNKFSVCIDTGNINEYLNLLSEILIPCLIIADILVMIPIIIYVTKHKKQIIKPIKSNYLFFYIGLGILLNIIVSFFVGLIPNSNLDEYNQIMEIATNGTFIATFFASGIIAPIMEELLFRFTLIEINKQRGYKYAIFISSVLFGVAHMNLIQSLYAFFIGIVLGIVYYQSKNILASIVIHATINMSSIIYEYLPNIIFKNGMIIIGSIISIIIIYIIIKNKSKVSLDFT